MPANICQRSAEARLIDTFGDDYRAYMQETGGLLPKVGALLKLANH